MKYNLGSGNDYKFGWVNCDKYIDADPDLVVDLESFPWPIEDDSADEVLLSHVLEHLGGNSDVFLSVMKELYRICRAGASIRIRVPDPRHNDYFADPTHQRPILPEIFQPLDLALNENWQSRGLPGTPLGKYLKIDLPTVSVTRHLDPRWLSAWNAKSINDAALGDAALANNNVVQWSEIVLEARKPFRPGRSLEGLDALIVRRVAGIGDVLMALSALSAIKRTSGVPVYLETSVDFAGLAAICSDIDGVFQDAQSTIESLAYFEGKNVRYIDWSPAHYGISRLHQVDAFLMSLGLTLSDSLKSVVMYVESEQDVDSLLSVVSPGTRRVVLHPGQTDPNRTWPLALWQNLAESLMASGDAVIVIGARHSADGRGIMELGHPLIIDLTDRLNLEGTIRLLESCDVLISGDSGPIQLAGTTDIEIIGLYSVVSGDKRLPFRQGSRTYKATAVSPSCPFHPCYPRLNDPEAVERFCAEESLTPVDTPALFARWCVNPDRYACLRDPGVITSTKTALGLPLG